MSRQRSSTAKDLVDIVASLPWWAGVLLALGSYVLFTMLAQQPLASGGQANLVAIFASALRIAAPILFLIGAVLSAVTQVKRTQLYGEATSGNPRSAIASMSWREFELLISEAYRRQGYAVAELGGGGPDGGVDLILTREGRRTLVQCKHWRAFSVGAPVVRELLGVMTDRGAHAGQVVTSGKYTAQAREFAAGHRIELIDGTDLTEWFAGSKVASGRTESQAEGREKEANAPAAAVPTCPTCMQPMVRRVAGRGPAAGRAFWGCSTFPRCKGTRPLQ
jgi:restriction system protein